DGRSVLADEAPEGRVGERQVERHVPAEALGEDPDPAVAPLGDAGQGRLVPALELGDRGPPCFGMMNTL
ncbi:MAG: hypothetical protein ACRDKW_15900, partial [Actinomycetota bacterium]